MRPSVPRKTADLSDSVHRQLNMYALAASAAGVGVLALGQPAEVRIIYTPAHRVILSKHEFSLDLNHDGIADFTISNHSFCTTDVCGRTLRILPTGHNKVVGVKGLGGPFYASALKRGSHIGPKRPFSGRLMAASGTEYATVGPWLNIDCRYLGLKFFIKGHIHYGWARFNVTAGDGKITATSTGYAYETIAGKSIIAGKTHGRADDPANDDFSPDASLTNPNPDKPQLAYLGLLALGAQGVPLWRQKETQEVIGQ
jgi:hypothetical protein